MLSVELLSLQSTRSDTALFLNSLELIAFQKYILYKLFKLFLYKLCTLQDMRVKFFIQMDWRP